MKRYVVVVALLFAAGLAAAQDKPQVKSVRVIGTAEVKVVPDRAVIQLGVETQDASASRAKQTADAKSRRILASLRANGIEEKDIQTTFLSLQPQYDYRKGQRISYFVADQTLSVTVRDIFRLDSILESLIKAGGNRIDSIQYETSDLRKYRDQARELAVKAAREKAQALAGALGQEIGKPQSIEEVPESTYSYVNTAALGGLMPETKVPARVTGPSTAPGQEKVSASVVVSFELE